VLNLGHTPLADQFPATPHTSLPRYPLRMGACKRCGLAQLMDVVDDSELFGADYGFRTSGSPSLVRYYREWAVQELDNFPQARKLTVDIGCNDGTLLREFAGACCPVIGVDPSVAAAHARDAGITVYRQLFDEVTAAQIHQDHGPAGLVTGINVAAHVADPLALLRAVAHLLDDDGVAIFEFHDLRHLVAGCQFDQVYHEHRFFYSAGTFAAIARQAGLACFRVVPTPGQGGSLRCYLRKGGTSVRYESPLTSLSQLLTLQARAEWVRAQLVGKIEARTWVAGYGATAKSCTLLNFCGINSELLRFVEDLTPNKTGRYTPGTDIPITSPARRKRVDTFLLLAWNFLGDIIRREQEFLNGGGQFIVPVPVPQII
jgi:methylation protein EvaC